ncbi:unnamed protein product [Linum tenue]|uniref:TIR domain-containing protein n=1 Tax=Linum tenue TaxID=586396 RepID=A0AAV0MEF9_9ROSI|nr:unnamed protein product [Linum tenue]
MRKKINCFVDDNLERGGDNSYALEGYRAIKDFGGDLLQELCFLPWRVDELAKILDCRNKYGLVVLPVFYCVGPCEVDKQNERFADAIFEFELNFKDKLDKVPRWRSELTRAASIYGWDYQVIRPKSILVNEIVEDILKKLNGASSGKTTIAQGFYSDIYATYEGCCFFENGREEAKHHGGLVHLRRKFPSQILEDQNLHYSTTTTTTLGSTFTVKRIQRKRVLLVLDDVNDVAQVEFLIGMCDLFDPESRVILTSRDKQVLENWVDEIYEVQSLDHCEALLLFSSKAIRRNCPMKDFVEESNTVLNYLQDNRLALKGTEHVEGIFLDVSGISAMELGRQAFSRMHNLRLLKGYDCEVKDSHKKFLATAIESTTCFPGSKILVWFCCHSFGCSLTMQLPSNWTSCGFWGLSVFVVLDFKKHHYYYYDYDIQLKCTIRLKAHGVDSAVAVHHC